MCEIPRRPLRIILKSWVSLVFDVDLIEMLHGFHYGSILIENHLSVIQIHELSI